MAYRDEDRGFPLARILPSSHLKSSVKESTCLIDKRLNLLVQDARSTLLYSTRYLRAGLGPDRGAPNLEQ